MRVLCKRAILSTEETEAYGDGFRAQDFHVSRGRSYLVFGLHFAVGRPPLGTGAYFQVASDFGHLGLVPAVLFDLTDPRVSGYWVAAFGEDGELVLEHPDFSDKYFLDDLSEDRSNARAVFERVRQSLEDEFRTV
jgi:hypothetical protein